MKNTKFYVIDSRPYVTVTDERPHVLCKKHMKNSMFQDNKFCKPQGLTVTRRHATDEPCEYCELEKLTKP